MLSRIPIPPAIDSEPIAAELVDRLAKAAGRIQSFQDRWDRPQIEQFVAADYAHVYQAIRWTLATQIRIGDRFLEWGCGFSVVSAMASTLGLDVVGIESESELLAQGRQTIADWFATSGEGPELVCGNFLPPGAEGLADDPMLPSLGHPVPSAYKTIGLDLDDFAIVYSYPWPGEDEFHETVFDRHAAAGALLLMFCGPNDLRLMRKRSGK